MEPSGVMDNKTNMNDFDVMCDVGDEEVHFSRDVPFSSSSSTVGGLNSATSKQRSFSITVDQINPALFLNSTGHLTDINLNGADYYSTTANAIDPQDRLKSSRLLNSIGSKLRRGSNYLIAPQLVGKYLLGITIQSWSEFLNTSRMLKTPSNAQQLTRRLLTNLSYFQGNYLCISLILIIYCILTSPLLLLAILCYILALYSITSRSALGKPTFLCIAHFRPNLQQQYSFVTLVSLPLLWVAGAPSAVFWVIGASFVVVGLHASMYNNERALQEIPCGGGGGEVTTNVNYHQLASAIVNPNSSSIGAAQRIQTAQYYNHYPTAAHQYLSLPSGINPVKSQTAPATVTSSGGYANAISQWMTFNRSKSLHSKLTAKGSNESIASGQTNSSPGKDQNGGKQRTPEVMIISQDYAGLGRVYEV